MRRTLILCLLINFEICCGHNPNSSTKVYNSDSVHNEIITTIASFEHGKSIFIHYCDGCHYKPDSHVIADPPIFDSLFEKLPSPSQAYFVKFLQDSKALKLSGDEHANKIDRMSDQAYEHNFKDSLTQQDFSDLISYFKIGTELRYK